MSIISSYCADYANKVKDGWVEALKLAIQTGTVPDVIQQMEEFYFDE